MYFVYILRCSDLSLYCGYTNDVEHRISAHMGEVPGGAKYTRSRRPVRVEAVWSSSCKSAALKLERRIKMLGKAEKESLISSQGSFEDLFGAILDVSEYSRSREYERDLN